MIHLNVLSRKEREFIQRRESILSTALKLFGKKGFHKVSMSEIAKDSEFSVGSLYNFFPNKEALYKAMILERTDKLCEELSSITRENQDEFIRICRWVDKKVELYKKNINTFRLFFSETIGINAIVKAQISSILKEKQQRLRLELAELFASAIEKKQLPPMGEPVVLATALDGICNTLLSAEEESKFKNPVNADTILKLFFSEIPLPPREKQSSKRHTPKMEAKLPREKTAISL